MRSAPGKRKRPPSPPNSSAGVRSGKRPPTPAPRLSRSAAEARAMRPSSPIALVTGANRGIGFEVCRQLSESGMRVLLAARDPAKGEAAARALAREGLAVEAVSLDVTEAASIRALHPRLATVDVLVNVLPAERGNVGEKLVGDDFAARAQLIDGAAEIDGVPEDDGGDGEIETGGAIALAVFPVGRENRHPRPVGDG